MENNKKRVTRSYTKFITENKKRKYDSTDDGFDSGSRISSDCDGSMYSDYSVDDEQDKDLKIKNVILENLFQSSPINNLPWIEELKKEEENKLNFKYIQTIDNIINKKLPSYHEIINEPNISDKTKASFIESLYILLNEIDDYATFQEQRRYFLTAYDDFVKNETLYSPLDGLLSVHEQTLKEKILHLNCDKENKRVIYEQYKLFETMGSNGTEYHKLQNWLHQVVKLPFKTQIDTQYNLKKIREILDEKVYGLEHVKDRIIEIVNNRITNPYDFSKQSIALVGPPGCGKTELMRGLSDALKLPFQQISLGGNTDVSFLEGHSYTYEGSVPGIISRCMQKNKINNGIIYFDEFDKLSESDKGKEVAWSLLHIIDPIQNKEFEDKFFHGIKIDLSNVFFCYAMNDETNIPDAALLDRLNIIYIDGYNVNEKIDIVNKFLLNKHLKRVNYKKDLNLDISMIRYIIEKYTLNEKGVRKLDFLIGIIVDKLNLIQNSKEYRKKYNYKSIITKNLIDLFLNTTNSRKNTNNFNRMYM